MRWKFIYNNNTNVWIEWRKKNSGKCGKNDVSTWNPLQWMSYKYHITTPWPWMYKFVQVTLAPLTGGGTLVDYFHSVYLFLVFISLDSIVLSIHGHFSNGCFYSLCSTCTHSKNFNHLLSWYHNLMKRITFNRPLLTFFWLTRCESFMRLHLQLQFIKMKILTVKYFRGLKKENNNNSNR